MNIYDITGLGPKQLEAEDLDEKGPGFHKGAGKPDHSVIDKYGDKHMDADLDPEMPGIGSDHMDAEVTPDADPEGVVATNMITGLDTDLDPDVAVTVTKAIDLPLSAIEQIGKWRDVAVSVNDSPLAAGPVGPAGHPDHVGHSFDDMEVTAINADPEMEVDFDDEPLELKARVNF